jgi:hypothetical protein
LDELLGLPKVTVVNYREIDGAALPLSVCNVMLRVKAS